MIMAEIITGKPDCNCCSGSTHLFWLSPDGIVQPTETDPYEGWKPAPGSRLVSVPAEIVEYLQDGGLTC